MSSKSSKLLTLVKLLSRVRLFAIPWTVAYQAPPSMGFPGKNTRVSYHFLLQGIFLTQGLNPGLPRCRQMLYHLSQQGSPLFTLFTIYYLSIPLSFGILDPELDTVENL